MLFKRPTPSYLATQRQVQKLALKFVKRLRHVPCDAALQQLQLVSLAHRRIRGDLMSMFMITHGLLEFPMESTFVHPTRTGLRGLASMFHQQRCCVRRRQYAFSNRAVPFWNNLPPEIVNASPVFLPKTIHSAHIISFANSHPRHPFHMLPRLFVYNSPNRSLDQ